MAFSKSELLLLVAVAAMVPISLSPSSLAAALPDAEVSGKDEKVPSSSWVALAVLVTVTIAFQVHKAFATYTDYNHILKEDVLQNGGSGYLNMGLWMEKDIEQHYNDDQAVVDAIYDAIDMANNNTKASDAVPRMGFKDAQERMYQLFFVLGGLKSKSQNVLETGPGSCEHYLLWDKWGLLSNVSCYEKYTKPSSRLLSAVKKARKGSALGRMQRFKRLAETVGDDGSRFDRIVAVESAFHYPDRVGFFQKCYDALKPGGKLIMTDLVKNPTYEQNALWDFVWWYYWRHILSTPKENASVDITEYEEQLRSCGFSEVIVIDITALALRPFYEKFVSNVEVGVHSKTLQNLNLYFSSRLAHTDENVHPMKYSFALCTK